MRRVALPVQQRLCICESPGPVLDDENIRSKLSQMQVSGEIYVAHLVAREQHLGGIDGIGSFRVDMWVDPFQDRFAPHMGYDDANFDLGQICQRGQFLLILVNEVSMADVEQSHCELTRSRRMQRQFGRSASLNGIGSRS